LWDELTWSARRDQWLEVQSEGGMPDELQSLSL